MIFLILLAATDLLTAIALRQHYYTRVKTVFYILIILHVILSLWLWMLFIAVRGYSGAFDSPGNIWNRMQLTGMIAGVVVPRTILVLTHFSGKLIRLRDGGHIYWLTNSGLSVSAVIFLMITAGTMHGRFNFRTDEAEIKIKGLHKDLDGLRIVQISDLHLSGFLHHRYLLAKQMDAVNALNPDLLVNTGDFITYGWREFNDFDTILSIAKGKYGSYAVLGNHDFGTYHPYFTETDRKNNVLRINHMVESSGYTLLNDEHTTVHVNGARIGLIGIITMGRYPDIIHGDLDKAIMDLDSVDFKILLSHDPNQWELAVAEKTDIDLTLSGHTHGMQMGILSGKLKWSPSKYFYPHWSGLFLDNDQFHYVNRGLGVLSIPFRIWMPQEITLITLRKV
jgi:hypothetical protein